MSRQRLVDLLTLAGLALLGLSAYLTWATAEPGNGRPEVVFNGYSVTRAPVMAGLAAVVAVVITKLAGGVLRRILLALVFVLGASAVWAGLRVRPDEAELARLRPELSQAVTDSFGIGTGIAPWFAVAGGLVLVGAGLAGLLTVRQWGRATSRYERDPGVAGTDRGADQWKAIDAGEDPTL